MRTIILSFPDNKAAEEFARGMLECQEKGMPFVPRQTTIDAMVARPTMGCSCRSHGTRKGNRTISDFTLAERFGWFVHKVCKRPTQTIVNRFVGNMLGGCKDLLPELDSSREPANVYDRETWMAVGQQQMRRSA